MNCIVVHYSEIGIKGGNRNFFEQKLVSNLKSAMPEKSCVKISRLYGRIVIELGKKPADGKILERLRKIAGVGNFSFALSAELDINSIKKALDRIAEKQKISKFAVSASRSNKNFRYTSHQLNEILGDYLRKKYGWKVDLSHPGLTFYVEITEKCALVYTEKTSGLGGLPVTSSGRLISLISGGIDSPVAALEMMKRGCSIVFVHFHNLTQQKDIVKDKVEKIVKMLAEYQPKTKLYLIPFGDLQQSIIAAIPAKYRMIVYRRAMFSIANRIAESEKALGLVTGDSVGQVASQTLENLNVIYKKARFPVFAPLIGSNKEEIIRKAEQIGTYALSILPYSDCCSFLVAQHPETRSNLGEIEKIENAIGKDLENLINSAIAKSEIKTF